MPKVVDHDERRREVARAAVRVIAREGLDGATTRVLAREGGWSTGVLKHYFAGKDDVLRYALRELEEVHRDLIDATATAPTGYEQLRAAVLGVLTGDPDHSKVWIAFVSRAATDPLTAKEMRRGIRAWQGRWQKIVLRGQKDGSIRANLDPVATAAELWALVNGMRIGEMFLTARRQDAAGRAVQLLEGIRGGQGSTTAQSRK